MSSRCRERSRVAALAALTLIAALVAGCERESRQFDPPAPGAVLARDRPTAMLVSRYERNAHALAAGKRLYTWFNCAGCHAAGGGGAGPALMDDVWIYGGDADAIVASIAKGRPNGMPAFGARLSNDQVWQLAADVRSTSGLAPQDAAPNRDDAFLTRTPEAFMDSQDPGRAIPAAATGAGR
jgi:cytochrome c oxidase cbb3-type subunit 3